MKALAKELQRAGDGAVAAQSLARAAAEQAAGDVGSSRSRARSSRTPTSSCSSTATRSTTRTRRTRASPRSSSASSATGRSARCASRSSASTPASRILRRPEATDDGDPSLRARASASTSAWREIRECLEKGWTGLGYKTVEFEEAWRDYTGLAARALPELRRPPACTSRCGCCKERDGWQDGDEVITTPLTFVSTNHAILYERLTAGLRRRRRAPVPRPAIVARADHAAHAGRDASSAWAATPAGYDRRCASSAASAG